MAMHPIKVLRHKCAFIQKQLNEYLQSHLYNSKWTRLFENTRACITSIQMRRLPYEIRLLRRVHAGRRAAAKLRKRRPSNTKLTFMNERELKFVFFCVGMKSWWEKGCLCVCPLSRSVTLSNQNRSDSPVRKRDADTRRTWNYGMN